MISTHSSDPVVDHRKLNRSLILTSSTSTAGEWFFSGLVGAFPFAFLSHRCYKALSFFGELQEGGHFWGIGKEIRLWEEFGIGHRGGGGMEMATSRR